MDLNRLSKGEQILGVSAVVLLVLSFFPLWAKVEIEGAEILGIDSTTRYSGWSEAFNLLPKLAFILTILAIVLVLIRAAGTQMNLPVPAGQLYIGLAGLALLLLLITVLTGPRGGGGVTGFEISRGLAVFIGPILAAAMTYGAYLHMQTEGGTTGSTTPGTTTPPPPAS